MWISKDGKLHHVTDVTRVKFRTNISKNILDGLELLAEEHNTYVNYLLETGMKKVIDDDVILFDKKNRPKDRVPYKTSYDEKLITEIRDLAKRHKLCTNDVIEYSSRFINLEECNNKAHRFRIERL